MRAAGPLLLLLGRLRVALVRASFASLMEQVADAIKFFEKDIRSAGISEQQANIAKYILCATADDIVQNIPTEDRHVWTQYSMLSRFFGERIGGVRFFEELERAQERSARQLSVLELQHACLALGFQGMHRTTGGGAVELQKIQRNLYETLRRVRPKIAARTLAALAGPGARAPAARACACPSGPVAGVAALSLFALFVALRATLADAGERVAEAESRACCPDDAGLAGAQRCRLAAASAGPVADPASAHPRRARGRSVDRMHAGRTSSAAGSRSGSAAASCSSPGRPACSRGSSRWPCGSPQTLEKEAGPMMIVGHTDNQPISPTNRFQANQQLSVERARAVAALMRPSLADPSRIATRAAGPTIPSADNKTAEGRARNRRVEFLVTRIDDRGSSRVPDAFRSRGRSFNKESSEKTSSGSSLRGRAGLALRP